jgi:isocitrate dehydrogenase kinase/phosphatase
MATERTIALRGATLIATGFVEYRSRFAAITRRAPIRFADRDWAGGRDDAVERLELYKKVVTPTLVRLETLVGPAIRDRLLWTEMKDAFVARIQGWPDMELAETFFNSLSRKVFTTVGVDPQVEFVASEMGRGDSAEGALVREYLPEGGNGNLPALFRAILKEVKFSAPWEDLDRDAAQAAAQLSHQLCEARGADGFDAIELLRPVFFRNKGAYLVGKVRRADGPVPLVVSLLNPDGKVVVDAVLLQPDEVSIVFSFTRSYFHVETSSPSSLIRYLKTIMPKKPISELYTEIGHNKHGKTELFRNLLSHMGSSTDQFVRAPGVEGMVMTVFTLSSYDVVFKIIKDSFPPPKTATRAEVQAKYRLVFRHGRAGRLIDTQEFEHLEFPKTRFEPRLLESLLAVAGETVRVEGDRVVIRHLYTERRLTPLDLFLQEAPDDEARKAVLDFGEALKELASTNVFPGDLLLKNFGVTRHGRVVFYDYDELCLLTDCNFREIPEDDDGGEPSFYVGASDVFPEEFLPFLGLKGAAREAFLAVHRDLLGPGFWSETQERIRAGEMFDVFPYPAGRRLGGAAPAGFRVSCPGPIDGAPPSA